ncbi:hypothetical protein F4779DRAFT_576130 [Xylariaceae sp. FL0662B]|nr:hypothetical protein F4779DRAFT_576130 [Xylariaceae sp. FL0662B]
MGKKSRSISNTPRLNPYLRLISRFYEPLVLLRVLGKTRRAHLPGPYDSTPLESKRRRFLRNLSYLCDYEKGGQTTCSIGIEDRPECFNFWVASNKISVVEKMIAFLEPTLKNVKRTIGLGGEKREDGEKKLIHMCIQFAKSRVKKEMKLLITATEKFKACLERKELETDAELVTWLGQFNTLKNRSEADACYLAYKERKSPQMTRLSDIVRKHSGVSRSAEDFEVLRHYVGRLAHHIRAPKQVLEDAAEFDHLFDEYHIRPVRPRPSNPRPSADSLTTLSGILRRMLPAGNSKLPEYQKSLDALDQKFQVLRRVLDQYNDKNFQPIVHAEILVLEHFYENQLAFISDDKYIGCSKPACYCCHLYFRYHPFRPVEPESHQNVYPNWGVPALGSGANDSGYKPQLDLLNHMLEPIRKDALDQIERQAKPFKWHADSETGITKSVMTLSLESGSINIGRTSRDSILK